MRATVRNGFTLVELLIVILIMAIVAMMVGPSAQSLLVEARLNEAAGEVAGALEYAGSCAILYQRPFAVGWIPSLSAIAVCDRRFAGNGAAHPDEDPVVDAFGVVRNPFDKKPYAISLGIGQGTRSVRLIGLPEDVSVVFYPDGHASPSSVSIGLAMGDLQRTITVVGSTGRVTVE